MSGKQYLKDQWPAILMNLLGMLALSLFLLATGNPIPAILVILAVWWMLVVFYMIIRYYTRKKYLDRLLDMAEQLEERYLLPELMTRPDRADDQVFYQMMKMSEKSMLETIGAVQRERKEYKEYIEQWIHEVKTPMTAMNLICENNPAPCTRDLLAELEQMNHFTEQALYYARSEHTEKDYSIRAVDLNKLVHQAIAENKYLLRQSGASIVVDAMEDKVYTDDKWVGFILNQIISNAVKYRAAQPVLHFYAVKMGDAVVLSVEDNGMGIPDRDMSRIFEKGFTGENGRKIQGSTGLGLYLCRRLCHKLGIGLAVRSHGKGTTVSLAFHLNNFLTEARN